MTTLVNNLIKFLCKHCHAIYLDTFYQVCEGFSKIQQTEQVAFYAKLWTNYKMKMEKQKNED